MKHLEEISSLIKTLVQSPRIHALVIQSPPGFAKSTTVERLLHEIGASFHLLGSVATPLSLYNSLCGSPDSVLVIDDCVFGDPLGMAVLKAATWPSSGSNGKRIVTWSSTGERALKPSFEFHGKILLLTNQITAFRHSESFLSRALFLELNFSPSEVAEILGEATRDPNRYADQVLAKEVSQFLIDRLSTTKASAISLRTLEMGYELARTNQDSWRHLLARLLPENTPDKILSNLTRKRISVNSQVREFIKLTGLSRRSFFNHRNRLRQELSQNASCTKIRGGERG